jgi:hypothetical protein
VLRSRPSRWRVAVRAADPPASPSIVKPSRRSSQKWRFGDSKRARTAFVPIRTVRGVLRRSWQLLPPCRRPRARLAQGTVRGEDDLLLLRGIRSVDSDGDRRSQALLGRRAGAGAHIDADRCACDVRNPRGTCCISDLIAAVKRVEAARQLASSLEPLSEQPNVARTHVHDR